MLQHMLTFLVLEERF